MIAIFIVDDQEAYRVGLRSLLSLEADFRIVGEAGDGQEAIDKLASTAADVVFMDLRMPRLDGIAATRIIRSRHRNTYVIALTTFLDDTLVEGAVRAGASGYVLKSTPAPDLAAIVRMTMRGFLAFSPETAAALAKPTRGAIDEDALRRYRELGETSRAVLKCLGLGYTNARIAETLHLTEGTVKNHVSEILIVMQFRNRLEAGIFAAGTDLSSPGEPRAI